jgi:hypothetical protein
MKEGFGISTKPEPQRDNPMVIAMVTCRETYVCVGGIVSGAHRDPRSCSDSVFQTIQDREVE